mmetsp:Transcript_16901/g.51272  ORF Transcript_16901/g.51272 Transcript_16901/m.51272 type:complete len:186 (-) Transcript_16901:357-914(-)|eukprot:CAMPEP_0198656458 /NCGR_PEP_ID=MMETSP1467-20131203/9845_1 /TAXON_ID=1462469 /ORGANISM="unid. sp., Strain CCMP2135" /LENGTH=185 /DNA_ID=CAMNT_0044392495 /DNA_START=42 /DNA_END=599 /DNA_ORIENTATION=+
MLVSKNVVVLLVAATSAAALDESLSYTFEDDTVLIDSTSWFVENQPSKDCSYVADAAATRCGLLGDDKTTLGWNACSLACANVDNEAWEVGGLTCDWVREAPVPRCLATSGTVADSAYVNCRASCADSLTFFVSGEPSKDCLWVADRPEQRCSVPGAAGACIQSCAPVALCSQRGGRRLLRGDEN